MEHEKQSREYLEAWRIGQAAMQELRDQLEAERERVRVLREAIREALPLLDGAEFRVLDHALQATAQEGE